MGRQVMVMEILRKMGGRKGRAAEGGMGCGKEEATHESKGK